MASTIQNIATRGTATSNQGSGAYGTWERVGNIVTFDVVLTHPQASYTILKDMPPAVRDCVVGVVGDFDTLKHLVWMTINGTMQIRTGAWSDSYAISGSYMTS